MVHQVEAQFAARNPLITADLTKFNHVVAVLDNVTAGEVKAIILSSPTNDKYEALKATLIEAFGSTQALAGLRDKKPSSLPPLHGVPQCRLQDSTTLLRALFLFTLTPGPSFMPASSRSCP